MYGQQGSFPADLRRMDAEIQRRLRWIELFLKIKNCSIVCLLCSISRPTLRKWVRQFQKNGVDGLSSASKRPKSSPAAKVAGKHRDWIRELRKRGLALPGECKTS